MALKIHTYEGQGIDITYDLKRCIHSEECVKRLNAVFNRKVRPWVNPDNAPPEQIAETIPECPSGALHYEPKDGIAPETTPVTNTIRLSENGPLYVRGDLTVLSPDGDLIIKDTRATLCRCGASYNKPFCDNSHIETKFIAPGTLMDPDAVILSDEQGDPKLTVQPDRNSSLHVTGQFEILSEDGEVIFRGDDVWLCRCGGSKNKPFCDDSHLTNGFVG